MNVLDQNSLAALRSLQDDADDDLLSELIDLFLQDAPARLDVIRDAIARQDWTALAAAAHSLKGSCGSLGALHMAVLCGRLERYGRTGGDRRDAEQIFTELEAQSVLVREALERERG
jgi:HPt (histidine-containing phosphotransfer) domain-containing protein